LLEFQITACAKKEAIISFEENDNSKKKKIKIKNPN
jgi:hypothetical protein